MTIQDPIRSAAVKSQHNVHEALGSLAEIQSMRTGLSSSNPVAPGVRARKDSEAFSSAVNELFSDAKYDSFRSKVQDIDLTVNALSNTKIGRPAETMNASLLTVRSEMTTIMIAVDKKPDPRLAHVVSAFADLERSGTAYALHEQKERTLATINENNQSGPGSMLRSALSAPAPGKKSTMALGLG